MGFDFDGKTLLLGSGRTGVALSQLLEKGEHHYVWIADTRLVAEPRTFLEGFQRIVASPGVPSDCKLLLLAEEKKIPIYSEPEVAYQSLSAPIAAITGTNGKTTVTELTSHILRVAGFDTYCVGNVGVPISSVVGQARRNSKIICEVSSFMLEHIDRFRPKVAAITNITPDHLDRHGSMEEYIRVKCRIFENMTKDDTLILCGDDEILRGVDASNTTVLRYSVLENEKKAEARLKGGQLTLREEPLLPASALKIIGNHNIANALCAALVAARFGASLESVREGLATFSGVQHRLEYIGTTKNGIRFYNDSKATNVDSTLVAMSAFQNQPVILLLGGSEKGCAFDAIFHSLNPKLARVVAFGAAAKELVAAAERARYPLSVESGFEDGVQRAFELARPGDIILLSPACASFDEFCNFEARGEKFLALARRLGAVR